MKIKKFLLPLVIVPSSFKFLGWSLAPLLVTPLSIYFFFENKLKVPLVGESSKVTFFYLIFFSLQSLRGIAAVSDPRILFWLIFFFTLAVIYSIHNFLFYKDKDFRLNYTKNIYLLTTIYFVLYLLVSFLSFAIYGNFHQIQKYWFIGSSAAFSLSIPYLFSLSILWKKNGYKIISQYCLSILTYIVVQLLMDSRLGTLTLSVFVIDYLIENFKPKKIITSIFAVVMIFYAINLGEILIFDNPQNNMLKTIERLFTSSDRDKDLSGDIGRITPTIAGIEKFKDSGPKEIIFGTGWYSSRVLIRPYIQKVFYDLNRELYETFFTIKSIQLNGFESILCDSGIIGVFFTIYLFYITFKNSLSLKLPFHKKIIFSFYLSIAFLILFIGYPLSSLAYFLIFLPHGFMQSIVESEFYKNYKSS